MKTGFTPILIAGGRGTRFWPRSRRAHAKQVLALDGERTMIERTAERLAALAPKSDMWVVTNARLAALIAEQLRDVPASHILCEPAPRNTAPAAALAAFLVERKAPDEVLGVFPADHTVADEAAFREALRAGIGVAAVDGNMVVLGVKPTRAETGYGYIETGAAAANGALGVRRFTEKPDRERAKAFVSAGNYLWNSGIFLWTARTLANAVREHLPRTAPHLEAIARTWGAADFARVFAEEYPRCENISLDYAILEPRSTRGEGKSGIYCLPADFGWNDLGSWAALYEHKVGAAGRLDGDLNVTECAGSLAIDATGNYAYSPGKFVALVGVKDLVVVETEDAILVAARDRSQDVGKVVKTLQAEGREDLL